MPWTFSPSSLSLLKECPRCFWLAYHGVKRPASIFPSLPSGMDRVLKTHFDSYMARGLLPPELASLNGTVSLFSDMKKLAVWRSNFHGVEWKDASGNLYRGAVDNLLMKDGKLIVLDYKTRGFPLKEDTSSHYTDQMDMYNLLLRRNGYATEDYAYLLFYHPDCVLSTGDVRFHAELVKVPVSVENAERIFNDGLRCVEGEMPDSAADCGFCKWREKN